jgi:Carboxypeptidase regulatory-like domain
MLPAFFKTALIVLLLLLFVYPDALGQEVRSSVRGTITDSDRRPIASVSVVAVQTATGFTREARSDANGAYSLIELPIGNYTLTFAVTGFASQRFERVGQAVGQDRTLNVVLKVATSNEIIQVSDAPVALNESSNVLGARMEREQVAELPLNGRNWSNLTALTVGAVDAGGSNQRTIRFAGRGLDDNDYKYDGIDATNIVNQAQPAFVRLAIPTDTIQEFQVQAMLFSADSGSTPGGQVEVASVAGTNQLHGDVYDFLRNDILDAREPIDTLNPTKPPFRLNQFGGIFGGPIVRQRTFFFVAFEGLRQDLGQTVRGFVPADAFRAQVAAQSPALIPLLNAYPIGQTTVNSQVAQFVGEGSQIDHENSGMLRLDHRLNAATTAYLRFNMDEAISNVPLAGSSGQYLTSLQETSSRPVNTALELSHAFSSSLINDVKFGFNRSTIITANITPTGLPYAISVSGLTPLTNNQTKIGVGNSFSWVDDITWAKAKHDVKAGIEIRRIQLNQGNTASGTFSFSSLSTFVANAVNSASYAAELPVNGLRKTEFLGYLQDGYKWTSNITINAGVRYQFYNRFSEVLGRAIPFDFNTCGAQGFCRAGAEFSQPNTLDVDPRLAVAWAPAKFHGKTVLRAGAGIYHGDGQLDDQNLPIANEVHRYSLSSATIPGLTFPIDAFLASTTGIVSPRDMDRLRKDMYVSQWGASVQQAFSSDFVGTLSYVANKGTHLLTTSYINGLNPATGTRPNTNFGQVEYRGNNNNSSFNGLQASLRRSFTRGWVLSANYLWSHEIDDGSLGGGDSDFPENVACRACERTSGDYDARQVFNASSVYQLPFGENHIFLSRPGVLQAVFGSWELTNIVTARTGLPVNVTVDRSASSVPDGNVTSPQRPNLVPGVPLYLPSGGINLAAFAVPAAGTFGDAPRNLLRGPGLWQADLGLGKHITITERVQLQFRAEMFNIFNRAQYASPQADISNPTTFGHILSTVNTGPVGTGTPRQVQFMLKAVF